MFDFLGISKKIEEVKQRVQQAQAAQSKAEFTVESGGGLVRVLVSGDMQLRKVEIDPSLWEESNRELCLDLIVAAINKATTPIQGGKQGGVARRTQRFHRQRF